MTLKEKILEAFPNANFETYDEGTQPSICPEELRLIRCPIDIPCEECWEMEYNDAEQLRRELECLQRCYDSATAEVNALEKANRELKARIDRMMRERGEIENVN